MLGGLLWLRPHLLRQHETKDPKRQARARQLAAAATITYRGLDWGEPLFSVELETLNATIDVHAYTEDEARERVLPAVLRALEERERPGE